MGEKCTNRYVISKISTDEILYIISSKNITFRNKMLYSINISKDVLDKTKSLVYYYTCNLEESSSFTFIFCCDNYYTCNLEGEMQEGITQVTIRVI